VQSQTSFECFSASSLPFYEIYSSIVMSQPQKLHRLTYNASNEADWEIFKLKLESHLAKLHQKQSSNLAFLAIKERQPSTSDSRWTTANQQLFYELVDVTKGIALEMVSRFSAEKDGHSAFEALREKPESRRPAHIMSVLSDLFLAMNQVTFRSLLFR